MARGPRKQETTLPAACTRFDEADLGRMLCRAVEDCWSDLCRVEGTKRMHVDDMIDCAVNQLHRPRTHDPAELLVARDEEKQTNRRSGLRKHDAIALDVLAAISTHQHEWGRWATAAAKKALSERFGATRGWVRLTS